jgi:hypothetical protein
MLVELFSAILLCVNRPKFVGMPECIVNVILLGIIWLSTMFIADQLHGSLGSGAQYPRCKSACGLELAAYSLLDRQGTWSELCVN